MNYCTIKRIRDLTGLTSEDVSDSELANLRDNVATPKINEDINQEIKDEKIEHVSSYKSNKIDGSNTTFYLKETHQSFREVGDLNDDGTIDESDIEVYYIDKNDNRVEPDVTSLDDASIGQFTLERNNSPLQADEVDHGPFVTYAVAPTDVSTPAKSIKNACAYLTGALGYSNINAGNFDNFSVGAISVDDSSEGSASEQLMKYQSTVNRLSQRELLQAGENKNDIKRVFT